MDIMNRRMFLHRSLGAAALLVTPRSLCAGGETGQSATPSPCAPAAWKKHGVVLQATEDWEGGQVQNFTSPPEPLGGDRWRLWYSACGRKYSIAYAEGVPGSPLKKVPVQRAAGEPGDGPFALGHLPDNWNPVQVVHIHLRNGRHRIYFWAHGHGIARYLAADSDDGKRYTVVNPLRPVLYHPSDRAAHGVASPDGVLLHKTPSADRPADEPMALARLISNDATNVYQLPDGTFEMYSVALVPVPKTDPAYIAYDNAPGLLRVVDRYTSGDGLHFESRKRVIQRDASDPVDQQFYYLAATRTEKGLVGMLGHYRCQAQTMDIEWCFSVDGSKWQRPRRAAWLPRGDKTQPDSYGTYAPSFLVQHGGRWHLFYTAVNCAHNRKDSYGPPRDLVMYATTASIWA
jgi:hypothetical protein